MLVVKFGGSSLGSAEMIRKSADIVEERLYRNPAVVVSAVGKSKGYETKITDALESCAREAYNGGDYKPHLDYVIDRHREILEEFGGSLKLPELESLES